MTSRPRARYSSASNPPTARDEPMADDLWSKLRRILREEKARSLLEPPEVPPEEYEAILRSVRRRMRREAACFNIARTAVEDRYQGFEDLPAGRRQTVLRSSRPQTLLALAQDLMRRSYAARFDHVRESLHLATLALEVVEHIGRTGYLSRPVLADLESEALAYLGNAQRISSDLARAVETFERAERWREAGTGDRILRADLLRLRAYLLNSQGEAAQAAQLQDREIVLRRLMGDRAGLGEALVARGLTASWDEGPTDRTCAYMKEGAELVATNELLLTALHGLAEAFARAGQAGDALVALEGTPLLLLAVNLKKYEMSHHWIQALTFRAFGDYAWAARRLEDVRVALKEAGRERLAAVAAMDLVAVYAAQGRYREAQALASEAWLTFQNEGLAQAGAAALLSLTKALQDESATGAVAMAIANYVARLQHNKRARLELPADE